MQSQDKFTYRTFWSEADREFVGLCAEFPSLSWLDDSHEKALKGIRRVVRDVIADMKRSAEVVPEPVTARAYSGELRVRLPPNLHRQLAIRAAEEDTSLNRIVIDGLSGTSWGIEGRGRPAGGSAKGSRRRVA